MSKNILYTGAFRFPDKDAAANRVFAIACSLKELGYKVDVSGWEQANGTTEYSYKDFNCYSMSELDKSEERGILTRVKDFLFLGLNTFTWIKEHSTHEYIFIYNPPFIFSILLHIWARKRGVKLVLDQTEWYEGQHLPGGKFGLCAVENLFRMLISNRIYKNVISISSYLHEYYSSEAKNAICLPPMIVDIPKNIGAKAFNKDSITFFYAGQAGKKDKLHDFITLLPKIENELDTKVVFKIAGTSFEELNNVSGNIELSDYKSYLLFLGRVSRDEVFNTYSTADFSVFFRENKRYAKAGYPTKAAESLTYGCPLLTNNVGDIGGLIKNNQNLGVLADLNMLEKIPQQLKRFEHSKIKCMSDAQKTFDYKMHLNSLQFFMERI